MPAFATLVKQGCFDNDVEAQINTNFGLAVNNSSVPGTVNGLATAGQGIPVIVAAVSAVLGFAVFNAAVAVNLLPATAPAGTYRITMYTVTTTTFVTNTEETITFGWTDDSAATTMAFTTSAKTAGIITPPISATVANSWTIRSAGTAAITYTPAVTGSNATAGAMAVSIVVERLV